MTTQQAEEPVLADTELETTVATYLQQHPAFLADHEDILTTLEVPHLVGAGAVSLIEYQVRVLRQQLDTERHRLVHLISRAREYESSSARLHALVLQLVSTNDPKQLCERLEDALIKEFRADAVTLKLFPTDAVAEGSVEPLAVAFQGFLERDHALCGPLEEAKAVLLFGDAGSNVRAAALVPIRSDHRAGVLAIGSSDPERFNPDFGTELLDRLGEILSHKLQAVPLERCPHE